MGGVCTKQSDVGVAQKLPRPEPSYPSYKSQTSANTREAEAPTACRATSLRVAELSEPEPENACPIVEQEEECSRRCLILDDDTEEAPKTSRGAQLCDEVDEDGPSHLTSPEEAQPCSADSTCQQQHTTTSGKQPSTERSKATQPCTQPHHPQDVPASSPDPQHASHRDQHACEITSTLPQEIAALCAEVEQCFAAPTAAGPTSPSTASASSQPSRFLTRTPSNASSIVSASHVAPGLQTPPSAESPFTGLASPRRKPHPTPYQQQQHQHQQRSQSVPKRPSQPQYRAASMQPGKPCLHSDHEAQTQPRSAGASVRKEPEPARRPNPASASQQKKPVKKPMPSASSSQSRLSKAAAFAAAAVVRSVPLQYPNYPNYPKYPNYPTPPASTHSAISEDPALNESLESMKELGDSLEWSELSSSLPPSCFGTARASRVLDSGEVQEMLGACMIGADAAAAAQRLHSMMTDGCRSESSATSSMSGGRSSSRSYHLGCGPSLHQHIYPGCPFPLTSSSSQKPSAAQGMPANSRLSGHAQLAAAAPEPPVHAEGSGHAISSALSSVAEEQDSRKTSRQTSECSNPAEADDVAAAARQDDSARILSSLSSLANAGASQDILGVSDLSSVAILAK